MFKVLLALVAMLIAFAGGALWLDRAPDTGSTATPADIEASAGAIYATRFPDVNGNEQMLGQWQDKLLVINFWATWCAPCREEMPMLATLQAEYGARGLQIVGIAADSRINVANFVQKTPFNYPLLPDEARAMEFSRRLGNRQGLMPYTLVLRPPGDVVYAKLGALTEAEMRKLITTNLKK